MTAIADQRAFAERLMTALQQACPESRVRLRGSLAADTDDQYSDVDLEWTVPDGSVDNLAVRIPELLPAAISVRSDPDFQQSRWRRLIFVRFADVPLFWRLDLDLRAESRATDDSVDVDNPQARGADWSLAESAAMNAIATMKALLRGRPEGASGLLSRGFQRIGALDPGGSWSGRIAALADAAAGQEPRLDELAAEIREYLIGQGGRIDTVPGSGSAT